LDRVDPLCKKPTPVPQLGQLLEYGRPHRIYPAALLGVSPFADHISHGRRFLVPGPRACPPLNDGKSGIMAGARFNVGSLLARGPILSPDSLAGDHASLHRLALPLDDLVLGYWLLERPTVNVERTEIQKNLEAVVILLALNRRDTLTRRVCFQRLEGSRFGPYLHDLGMFVSTPCTTARLRNRRLPRTTQRVVCLLVREIIYSS
jgi:hypothetical protein